MTRDAIAEKAFTLTDTVLSDWRWDGEDLSVSILGMLLYGFTHAISRDLGFAASDADAVVLRCLTERIGAAAKWSGGLVDAARAAADDKNHHPGHHELIGVGTSYHGPADLQTLVDNVFDNFASVRARSGLPEPMLVVFVNPLAMLLSAREQKKGSPLTEAEVLKVRDEAVCTQMPLSKAQKFYASLDARMPIPRLNPARIWEEWQAVRERLPEQSKVKKRWWQF